MVVVITDDDAGEKSSLPEQPAVPGDLKSLSTRERIHQSNTWFDSSTRRPTRSSSGSIARAARKPVPPMNTASASSPRWREIHSTTAPGSISPGSLGRSADCEKTTSNPSPPK